MTLEIDAAFLAGFIAGTYDLKGEQQLPACIKPVIDRVLARQQQHTAHTEKHDASHIAGIEGSYLPIIDDPNDDDVIKSTTQEIRKLAKNIVAKSQEEVRCNGGDHEPAEIVAEDIDVSYKTDNVVRPRRFSSLTDDEKEDIQKKEPRTSRWRR